MTGARLAAAASTEALPEIVVVINQLSWSGLVSVLAMAIALSVLVVSLSLSALQFAVLSTGQGSLLKRGGLSRLSLASLLALFTLAAVTALRLSDTAWFSPLGAACAIMLVAACALAAGPILASWAAWTSGATLAPPSEAPVRSAPISVRQSAGSSGLDPEEDPRDDEDEDENTPPNPERNGLPPP